MLLCSCLLETVPEMYLAHTGWYGSAFCNGLIRATPNLPDELGEL